MKGTRSSKAKGTKVRDEKKQKFETETARRSGRQGKKTEKAAILTETSRKRKSDGKQGSPETHKKASKVVTMEKLCMSPAAIGRGKSQVCVTGIKAVNAAMAHIVEDDTEFLIEVEGQASEFMSEPENEMSDEGTSGESQTGEESSSGTEDEMEKEDGSAGESQSSNNNATVGRGVKPVPSAAVNQKRKIKFLSISISLPVSWKSVV